MRTLKELIAPIKAELTGNPDVNIHHLTFDSRQVSNGSLFFAVRGSQADGHQFIEEVVKKEPAGIVCERLPAVIDPNVTYIKVESSTDAMSKIASVYYGNPSEKLKLIAITGTNGKTTVATLLFNLFREFGYHTGLLSTVQNQVDEEIIPATHTTPDVIRINELLATMVEKGCAYCFMEASSHAIDQDRIKGLHFAGAVFTNLSHDHLDYHKTFDHYLKAKKKLFDNLGSDAFALVNKDDRNGPVMLQNTKATRYTYALNSMADFKARIMESDFNGMQMIIDEENAWFRLVGHFNAYNLLAVYGTAFLLGKTKHEIITCLSKIEPVKGRFDYYRSDSGVIAIVDYAHTPDALKNVLQTINSIRTKNESLITVVGCGGNRDTAKRPVMADIATDLSNKVILTSDNPRNEDPEAILDEMQKGVKPLHFKKILRITDRKEAIRAAVTLAQKNDIILVAGKGHENYQEIKGTKYHFDDKEILMEMFTLLKP